MAFDTRGSFFADEAFPQLSRQPTGLGEIALLGFSHTKARDFHNQEKIVHFFLDDLQFSGVWNQPERYLNRLAQYRAVLSPGFHLYRNMPLEMQRYQTFRNRWCGAYWQAKGLFVIPTVCWSDERSFDFCFDAIEKGSVVAVSTLGSQWEKAAFLEGFVELCRRLTPERVICYHTPFAELYEYAEIIACPLEGASSALFAQEAA